jgi:FKBP-type peptidyl-prolyl cis-trans isomerase SlyD
MSDKIVEKLKIVSFTYSISDEQGQIVEKSDVPLDYLHGAPNNQMFPKIETALEGKRTGDEVAVTLTPAEGFGELDPDLSFTDDLENIPTEYRYVGARPEFTNDQGDKMEFVVTKIEDGQLTLDGNHPYAGKTITFHIKIDAIRDATEQELDTGFSPPPGPTTLQ